VSPCAITFQQEHTKVVEVRKQVTAPETGCYEVYGHEGCPQVKLTKLHWPS